MLVLSHVKMLLLLGSQDINNTADLIFCLTVWQDSPLAPKSLHMQLIKSIPTVENLEEGDSPPLCIVPLPPPAHHRCSRD